MVVGIVWAMSAACLQSDSLSEPIRAETLRVGARQGDAPLRLHSTSNRWARLVLSHTRVECLAPDVLAPEGVLSWGEDRSDGWQAAMYDLGGFDQKIDRLDSETAPAAGKRSDWIKSNGNPTLTMCGSADGRCYAAVDGAINLVWAPKGNYRMTFDKRYNATKGTIIVRGGTFELGGSGYFAGVPLIRVLPGATFLCSSACKGALGAVRTVLLGKGALLKVTGVDPFSPGETTVVCEPGARIESAVPLALKARVERKSAPPADIGQKLQVFWDDDILDLAQTTATRTPHQPEYVGKVFETDKPWEGDHGSYACVVKDGAKYRMYRAASKLVLSNPFKMGVRYTLWESEDGGVSWSRAKVNRIEDCGEKENNIIVKPLTNGQEEPIFWDNFMVFKDGNPDCPPSERWKAVALFDFNGSYVKDFDKVYPDFAACARDPGLWCFVSEDGIRFKAGWKLFSLDEHNMRFDTLNVGFWDAQAKCYRLYMRGGGYTEYDRYGNNTLRWIKTATSADFKRWTTPDWVNMTDPFERVELYTNNVDTYPRNPELIVGFPTRYTDRHVWSDNFDKLCGREKRRERMGSDPRHGVALTDCLFMWSRDGKNFRREEDAFLSPGPEFDKNWTYGSCYPVRGFVVSPGRFGDDPELSFYLTSGNWSGEALSLHRYALRMDGFVSYHGRYRMERVVTKPLVYAGDELLVNFKTSARGRLFITIRDANDALVRSCEMFGDKVDRIASFKPGEIARFAGKPVTVEFELSDADIYSFRFDTSAKRAPRAIDSASLASAAGKYSAELRSCGLDKLDDRAAVSFLAALGMEYRVTGSVETLKDAQGLFGVLKRNGRPASALRSDAGFEARYLAAVDSHFAVARDLDGVRLACSSSSSQIPLALYYKVKYRHDPAALSALRGRKLAGKSLPDDHARAADRIAARIVGASDVAGIAVRLAKLVPKDDEERANWLWAYWTARLANDCVQQKKGNQK